MVRMTQDSLEFIVEPSLFPHMLYLGLPYHSTTIIGEREKYPPISQMETTKLGKVTQLGDTWGSGAGVQDSGPTSSDSLIINGSKNYFYFSFIYLLIIIYMHVRARAQAAMYM